MAEAAVGPTQADITPAVEPGVPNLSGLPLKPEAQAIQTALTDNSANAAESTTPITPAEPDIHVEPSTLPPFQSEPHSGVDLPSAKRPFQDSQPIPAVQTQTSKPESDTLHLKPWVHGELNHDAGNDTVKALRDAHNRNTSGWRNAVNSLLVKAHLRAPTPEIQPVESVIKPDTFPPKPDAVAVIAKEPQTPEVDANAAAEEAARQALETIQKAIADTRIKEAEQASVEPAAAEPASSEVAAAPATEAIVKTTVAATKPARPARRRTMTTRPAKPAEEVGEVQVSIAPDELNASPAPTNQ